VTASECRYEGDVLRAVVGRRWPDAGDEALQQHVESCDRCAELRLVAEAFRQDHDRALAQAHVPASGQIWWRAALRAHAEATAAARRPMVWLQGIAGACAVGIGAGLIGLGWPALRDGAQWISAVGTGPLPTSAAIMPALETLRSSVLIVLAIAGGLLLAPLLVYFALSDE
jgi:hypothetical protein